MQLVRRSVLSLFLFFLLASAAFAGKGFVPIPDVQAQFNHAERFTPPELLPATFSDLNALSPAERARRASAVAVTPDGKMYRGAVTEEDLKIFERAISSLSTSLRPGEALSTSAKGLGWEATAGRSKKPGLLTGQTVIGTDDRIQVTPTTYWPWVTIGRIDLGCTGTIVGPRHVITAGHCVYDTDTDTWYYNLDFTPAQDGSYAPFGTVAWYAAITTTGWTVNHDRNYDYAMLVLADNIGYTTGYMSYGFDNNLCSNCIVNINGYPGDKPHGTMWHSNCPLTQVQTYRLYYECDTFGGNSGSGVYMYWSPDTRIIYGIHAYGVDGTGDNGGTRITSSVFYNFQYWREQFPPAY